MNIVDVLGAPIQDQSTPAMPPPAACSAPPSDPATPPPAIRTRKLLVAVAAVAALVLGGVGGWMVASIQPTEPGDGRLTLAATPVPADVAGTAELFTTLFLTGTASPDDLAALYAGNTPPPSGTWVSSSRTVSAMMLEEEVWNVTVAVDSLDRVDDEYLRASIRFFVVPVSIATGRPVAMSAPALVPPPVAAVDDDSFTGPVAVDQAAAATQFIERFLTGGDDIARYMSATARIPMFADAPYVSAIVTEYGADDHDRVRLAVTATNQLGIDHHLEYIVTLTFDGGVWEVADLVNGFQ